MTTVRLLICLVLVGPYSGYGQGPASSFFHWNGPFGGIALGRGWGSNEGSVQAGGDELSLAFIAPALDAGRIPTNPTVQVKGTFFSIHGGYDWRFGNIVLGAAGDIQLGRRYGSHTLSLPGIPRDANFYWVDVTTTTTQEVNRTSSLQARLGLVRSERWMAYITSGMVHAALTHRFRMNADASQDYHSVESRASAMGFLVGGGAELPLKERFRARIEYRYISLGERTYESTPFGRPSNLQTQMDITFRDRHNELMLGVVYALGQPQSLTPPVKKDRAEVVRLPRVQAKKDTLSFPTVDDPERRRGEQNILTNNDLIQLARHGMGDQVIISRIESSRDYLFDISTEALIELKMAGVSDPVIAKVIESANSNQTGLERQSTTNVLIQDVDEENTLPSTLPSHDDSVVAFPAGVDSIEMKFPNGEALQKPGLRMALGGFTALALGYEKEFPTVFGGHIGILIPASRIDIVAMGEFFTLPEVAEIKHNQGQVGVYHTVVPGSKLAALQIGVRGNSRALSRTGFYAGVYAGILHGWHTRTILTMPEYWPTNEPIPHSSMIRSEQAFQRWYWSPILECGWTFGFKADLALSFQPIVSAMESPYSRPDAFPQALLKARLSIILGNAGTPAARR